MSQAIAVNVGLNKYTFSIMNMLSVAKGGSSKAFYLSHPCEREENLHVFKPEWNPSFCGPGRRSGPNLVVMEECQLV